MTEQEQLARILTSIESINGQVESINGQIEGINGQVESINGQIEGINQRLDRMEETIQGNQKRLEDEVKRWDDRFFQLAKEQGQTARTIIIAAASVAVLSPALGAAVEFFNRFLLVRR